MKANTPVQGVYLFVGIFGIVFALLWALSSNPVGALKDTTLLAGVALIASPFVVYGLLATIAIHEWGHLLAGRKARFRFVGLRIGPHRWDGARWRTNWKVGLPMGFCEMAPPLGGPTYGEAFLFVAGGPIASGLAALVGTAIQCIASHDLPALTATPLQWARLIVACLGIVMTSANTWMLLLSLLPFRLGSVPSDGLQLLDLWRRRPARVRAP